MTGCYFFFLGGGQGVGLIHLDIIGDYALVIMI